MLKRVTVMLLLLVVGYLAIAPETFACDRRRRASFRAYNRGFSPYRYSGVASDRFYRNGGYYRNSDRYYGNADRFYRRDRLGSTGRAILTVAAPAAIGAGVGALVSGKKGALVGALLGGGGGAAYHLIRNRRDRDRFRFRR